MMKLTNAQSLSLNMLDIYCREKVFDDLNFQLTFWIWNSKLIIDIAKPLLLVEWCKMTIRTPNVGSSFQNYYKDLKYQLL